MARPNKFNLQYFPLDVDFFDDHKVVIIEETAQLKGGYIALRLMAMVYADKGYYLEWPEKFEFTAAKRIGNNVTGALVGEIFKLCLKSELFDNEMYNKYKIVTSHGIQKRWFKVMSDCRRKIVIRNDYWLVSSEEMGVSSEETTVSATFSTQKEMKGNEIKGKSITTPGMPATDKNPESNPSDKNLQQKRSAGPRQQFIAPTHQEVKKYFQDHTDWPEDVCHNEALAFIGHYTANGWVQGKNKPIVEWKGACVTWLVNKKKGNFEPASTNNFQKQPQTQFVKESPKVLSKIQRDINYIFERYLEDPTGVTVISIDTQFYDLMKSNGIIQIQSNEEIADISNRAYSHLTAIKQDTTEKAVLSLMKKIAVLDFFKNRQDRKPIFSL